MIVIQTQARGCTVPHTAPALQDTERHARDGAGGGGLHRLSGRRLRRPSPRVAKVVRVGGHP